MPLKMRLQPKFPHYTTRGFEDIGVLSSGLMTVPLRVTNGAESETAALVAGIAGFTMGETDAKGKKLTRPWVQANHAWAMMLEPDSVLRSGVVEWEAKARSGG